MKTSHKILLAIVVVAGAFALGKYTTSPKTVVETKIEYEEKIVTQIEEKIVEKVVEVEVERIRTVIEKPDGTKITVEHDKSKTKEEEKKSEVVVAVEEEIKEEIDHSFRKTEPQIRPQWHISASVGVDMQNLLTSSPVVYGAQVERRIVGPVFLGARADSNGVVSAVIGVEF